MGVPLKDKPRGASARGLIVDCTQNREPSNPILLTQRRWAGPDEETINIRLDGISPFQGGCGHCDEASVGCGRQVEVNELVAVYKQIAHIENKLSVSSSSNNAVRGIGG